MRILRYLTNVRKITTRTKKQIKFVRSYPSPNVIKTIWRFYIPIERTGEKNIREVEYNLHSISLL